MLPVAMAQCLRLTFYRLYKLFTCNTLKNVFEQFG